jgi:DNA-binding transcriptional MerR regulator
MERNKNGLRMRDLVEATSVPKSTILHYVAQGLLPEPYRTGRNMAYYDAACVERTKLIKSVQGRYSFPLEKIKQLLAAMDRGEDVAPFVELDAVVFGAPSGREMDEAAFREATGLKPEQVSELLAEGLLLPLDEGSYRQDDVEAGRFFAGGFSRGLQPSDLAFYVKIAGDVVDHEMRLRRRLTGHLPDGEDARVTADLTRGARTLRNYVIDRVFQRRVAKARTLKDEALLS